MPPKKSTKATKKAPVKKVKAAAGGAAEKEKNPGQVALDKKLAEEAEAKQAAAAVEAELAGRTSGKEWRITLPEMPKALLKAESEGKTPLLLDQTGHHGVDTFYSYQLAQVIEGKKLVMQGRDPAGLAQVMEESRTLLVRAMAKGYTLYLRMTNCAADLIGKYDQADTLPAQVWHHDVVKQVLDQDLFEMADHPLNAVIRDADCEEYGGRGMFFVHKDFRVIVCSHFSPEDYEEFLTRALPLDKMQAIIVEDTD